MLIVRLRWIIGQPLGTLSFMAGGKIEKWNKLRKLAKRAGEGAKKHRDTAGDLVRDGGEIATHITLALATKNTPNGIAGVSWLRFDFLGALISGAAMAFTKGKWRKGFRATLKGSLHAVATSWLMKTEIKVINGPDGVRFV